MHHNAWVDAGHFFVRPSKDVTKLVKKTNIKLNFLRSTSHSDIDMLDNPSFNRDVDWLSLCDVSQIPFRGHLIYLDGCLKGLRRETTSKLLEIGKHFLMGREERGTMVEIEPRGFLERHGL